MDVRRFAPATERNRDPILAVLRRVLPAGARVLEVASGTGQHAAYFAQALPGSRWQPSEMNASAIDSIDAWAAGLPNVLAAVELDVVAPVWNVSEFDAVFNANMLHISPWASCAGLMRGASEHLRDHGALITYGPYRIGGRHTATSNAAFDARLRSEDARWGVRDLEAVVETAAGHDLTLDERVEMPANNQLLIFRRAAR